MRSKDQTLLEEAYLNISERLTSANKREQTDLLKSLLDTVEWTEVFSRPEGQGAKVFITWLLDVAGWTEDADERLRGQDTSHAQKQMNVVNQLKHLMSNNPSTVDSSADQV